MKLTLELIMSLTGYKRNNISTMQHRDEKGFHFLELGVLTYLNGIEIIQLEFEVYKQDIKNSKMACRELLGYSLKAIEGRNIHTEDKALYRQKFKSRYFQILGAMSELAGHSKEEFIDENKMIKITIHNINKIDDIESLPAFKGW